AFPINVTTTHGASITSQTFVLNVIGPPSFNGTSPTSAAFEVGQVATPITVQTTESIPLPMTLTLTGKMPAGVLFAIGGTNTPSPSITFSGTPAAGSGGVYPVTLTVANASGKATETFTITVGQAPAITSAGTATFVMGRQNSFTIKTTGFPAASFNASAIN